MRAQEFVTELKVDNRKGLGAVPYNQEVDYFGLQVAMRPSTFLKLSLPLDTSKPDEAKTIDYIAQHLDDQGIGAPFLDISIPPEWEEGVIKTPARITGHDGRHRMYAIMKTEGDNPVEVHIFPKGGMRRRDVTPEMIEALRQGVVGQRGSYVSGPLFGEAK